MKGELSTAQDTVETNAKKTEEILTWQHSSIFQTTKARPSTSAEKQARSIWRQSLLAQAASVGGSVC